jgi:SAM-dependent methyltransferase
LLKRWFTDRWASKRLHDPHDRLAAGRARVSLLRNRILAELPFEHLDRCGLATTPASRDAMTVVAMKDRYGFPVRLAMCHQTGLFYLMDRLTSEGYDAFYRDGLYRQLTAAFNDEQDNGMNNVERQHAQATGNARAIARALSGQITLRAGAAVLDVGGSTGALSKMLIETYRVHATVVDPAQDELQMAKDAGIRTKCGLIEDVTFGKDEKFDLIIVNQAIEHLFDIRGAFTRLHDLLKQEGVLIFDILDLLALIELRGCIEAASQLDHCQYLYDEMVDAFCDLVGLTVRQRLFHKPGSILYICARSVPNSLSAIPPELHRKLRRRLLTQAVAWKKSRFLARPSMEERIVRWIASLLLPRK